MFRPIQQHSLLYYIFAVPVALFLFYCVFHTEKDYLHYQADRSVNTPGRLEQDRIRLAEGLVSK